MADNSVILKLIADTKDAQKSIADFTKSSAGSLAGIESAVSAIGPIVAALAAGFAAIKIGEKLGEAIEAASKAELALNQMNVALKLSGDFSDDASAHFQALASQIQGATGVSSELILQQVSVAKSLGATNDQTDKLIKASADFSAATGRDFAESVRQIGQTLDGTAGRLNEAVPGIRNLSEAALKGGAAIDYISGRFKGASDALGNTFQGQLARTRAEFNELFESIGRVIIQNPVFVTILSAAREGLQALQSYVEKNKVSFIDLINKGIVAFVSAIPGLVGVLRGLVEALQITYAVVAGLVSGFIEFLKLPIASVVISEIVQAFALMAQAITLATAGLLQLLDALTEIPASRNFLQSIGLDPDKISKDLETAQESVFGLTSKLGDLQAAFSLTSDGIDKTLDSASKAVTSVAGSVEGALNNFDGVLAKVQDGAESFADSIEEASKRQIIATNAASTAIENQAKVSKSLIDLNKFGFTALSKIDQGKTGAQAAIASGIGEVSNNLVPGSGPAAEAVFNLLAKGPEQVKSIVDSFIEGIPQILTDVAKSIPVLITELVREIPKAVAAFIADIPQIIDAFVQGIPDIISALVEGAPLIIESEIENAPKIIAKLVESAPQIIARIIQDIPKMIQGLITGFTDAVKSFSDEFLKIPEKFLQAILDGIKGAINSLNPFASDDGHGTAGSIAAKGTGGLLAVGSGGLTLLPGVSTVASTISNGVGSVVDDIVNIFAQRSQGGGSFSSTTLPASEYGRSSSDQSQIQPIVIQLQLGEKQLSSTLVSMRRRGFPV